MSSSGRASLWSEDLQQLESELRSTIEVEKNVDGFIYQTLF
eukprot:CAMPEP_0167748554 /NCGR_PEP_ID=MMETSP0110_2-20121227/4904_1 /TAXON_ID=629695 /ORGANISM="Gymnochlora sp., Strain CCMP2014" /LENGTH=40 /DNA_ID= /DNA_START= /DNA_END= /DNA_ORIENTATION=